MSAQVRLWSLAGLTAALGLALAVPAQATTIDVTSDGAAYGYDTVHLNASSGIFPGGATSIWVYSGADRIAGHAVGSGDAFSLVAFCVDAHDWLVAPSMTYRGGLLADTIGDPVKQAQIRTLVTDGTALLARGHYGAYSATEISSALQIAVWAAEYQTGDDHYSATDSSRGFWVSGPSDATDIALADTYLADVTSGAWTAHGDALQLEALNPQPNQNLAFAVPEPATFGLLGAGVLGLIARRRRRASGAMPPAPAAAPSPRRYGRRR
ncbi:MAG: PEP-CTERM sorting domain-containing protein [Alphaproteobacteria bacterium]|nr:PEP-CTERM sorting domain-containing protein [Alphaproteobacteria bacterium]